MRDTPVVNARVIDREVRCLVVYNVFQHSLRPTSSFLRHVTAEFGKVGGLVEVGAAASGRGR